MAWIASLALLVPLSAPIYSLPLIRVPGFAAGTVLDHRHARPLLDRIITRSDAPIVTRGPYRFVSHPNYAVTLAETAAHAPGVRPAGACGHLHHPLGAVLHYKIRLEDEALAMRRAKESAPQ